MAKPKKDLIFLFNICSMIVIFLLLILVPLFANLYTVYLLTSILILALAACSFNLLLGFTGILSFGHAGFFAIGAYTAAIILKDVAENFFLAMLGTIILTSIVAFIFALACMRVAEKAAVIFFAMLTLAFGQIVYTVAFKWTSLTGGDNGLTGIPTPIINFGLFQVDTFDTIQLYYFILVIVTLLILLIHRIINSPFGLILKAIRENKERTRFMGQNVRKYQIISFVISATLCGMAGALMQLYEAFASPELAHWTKSAQFVLVSILGGIYNFTGPIVGAFIMTVLHDTIMDFTVYWGFFLGIIVVLFVLFMPEGIVGRLAIIFNTIHQKIVNK